MSVSMSASTGRAAPIPRHLQAARSVRKCAPAVDNTDDRNASACTRIPASGQEMQRPTNENQVIPSEPKTLAMSSYLSLLLPNNVQFSISSIHAMQLKEQSERKLFIETRSRKCSYSFFSLFLSAIRRSVGGWRRFVARGQLIAEGRTDEHANRASKRDLST